MASSSPSSSSEASCGGSAAASVGSYSEDCPSSAWYGTSRGSSRIVFSRSSSSAGAGAAGFGILGAVLEVVVFFGLEVEAGFSASGSDVSVPKRVMSQSSSMSVGSCH